MALQESPPTGQGTGIFPMPKQKLSKKQIDRTIDALKTEFHQHAEVRPEIARMGKRVGTEFIRVLLESSNDGALPQDVHQAIHFLMGWMIATSTADAKDQRLRDHLVEYALTEAAIYARAMSGTKRIPIPKDEETADGTATQG
jgi:hypothetical protein